MVEYSGVLRNYGVHPSRSLIQWSGSSRGIFWKPQQARSAIADSASITLATHKAPRAAVGPGCNHAGPVPPLRLGGRGSGEKLRLQRLAAWLQVCYLED